MAVQEYCFFLPAREKFWNHRIKEWFGLGGTLEFIQFQPHYHEPRLSRVAPSNLLIFRPFPKKCYLLCIVLLAKIPAHRTYSCGKSLSENFAAPFVFSRRRCRNSSTWRGSRAVFKLGSSSALNWALEKAKATSLALNSHQMASQRWQELHNLDVSG